MSFIEDIDSILTKAKYTPQAQTLTAPPRLAEPIIEEENDDDELAVVALPSVEGLVLAKPASIEANGIPVAVQNVDPENYIAAVSHAEDVEIRTNSLPEIKPAGKEFFFDKDEEPVVF